MPNVPLLVPQLNIARPHSSAETAGQKNSFYLEIDEDNRSMLSDDSTSGCGSLDPIYYSISSMSAKHSWIINEAFESDLEDLDDLTGSGYTTPEKRGTPPIPRRSTRNVKIIKKFKSL